MLLLVSANDKLQVVTSSAGTIDVHASWMDNVAGAVAPGRTNTNISAAATTNVVASPAAGTQRNIKTLHIRNRGAANNIITVQHTDGTTISQLNKVTLAPETTLQYIDEIGFIALAAATTTSTTGDLKPTHKIVADPGWIMWVDGSIGDALSGSTILADITTQALFTLYYISYTDINCPLLTSAGVATNRALQGTALAAYNAHCRMSLPQGPGRSISISGQGAGLTNRIIGSAIGAETETPTLEKTASHGHPAGPIQNYTPAEVSVPYVVGSGGGMDLNRSIPVGVAGGGQPLNIMAPTTFVNIMVRL